MRRGVATASRDSVEPIEKMIGPYAPLTADVGAGKRQTKLLFLGVDTEMLGIVVVSFLVGVLFMGVLGMVRGGVGGRVVVGV